MYDDRLLIYIHTRVISFSALKIFPFIFHLKPLILKKNSPEDISFPIFFNFSLLKVEYRRVYFDIFI
jgi:hypothetical protein